MSITNGKRAKYITFESIDGQSDDYSDGHDDVQRILQYESDYYGDHTENWIVVYEKGKEVSRYNMKFIKSIIWEQI